MWKKSFCWYQNVHNKEDNEDVLLNLSTRHCTEVFIQLAHMLLCKVIYLKFIINF